MQQTQAICDYCQEKPAVTTCEVCGSQVCSDDNLDYGCRVCGGGKTSVE